MEAKVHPIQQKGDHLLSQNDKIIVLATYNSHKVSEFKQILGKKWTIHDLTNLPKTTWIEDGTSFAENSEIKARAVYDSLPPQLKNVIILSDDSGLCVDALDGAPGIFSSRYAGKNATDESNNELLLHNLRGIEGYRRKAHFICVITLYQSGKIVNQFTGKFKGSITTKVIGKNGFGYDPLFIPDGFSKTVSEIGAETKNKISHRGRALKKLNEWLNET